MKVGDRVTARITKLEEFGIFAEHGDCKIFVLVTDWSWNGSPTYGDFNIGDETGVLITRAVPERDCFRGSIREYEHPTYPYEHAMACLKVGQQVSGVITRSNPRSEFHPEAFWVNLDSGPGGVGFLPEHLSDLQRGDRAVFEVIRVEREIHHVKLRFVHRLETNSTVY